MTQEQIDAAVNWYYDNLHEYKEPERSFTWYLAQLYVSRVVILSFLVPVLLSMVAIWAFWLSPFAPFSSANQLQAKLTSHNEEIQKRVQSILSISQSESAIKEAKQLESQAKVYLANEELNELAATKNELLSIDNRLQEEFAVVVVTGENQRSAVRRDFDEATISGYYLIVQARDKNGRAMKRTIQDIETDSNKVVDIWGEKVPVDVYERLKKDKTEDGILNETAFGQKQRGFLNIEVLMRDGNNQPLQRGGQITRW